MVYNVKFALVRFAFKTNLIVFYKYINKKLFFEIETSLLIICTSQCCLVFAGCRSKRSRRKCWWRWKFWSWM